VVKVSLIIENESYLPTNITKRALEMEIAKPIRATIDLKDAELVGGKARMDLGHLDGSRDNEGITRRNFEYVIKVTGKNPVATVTVQSEKGGTITKQISLVK
jgi:hypothetical protein